MPREENNKASRQAKNLRLFCGIFDVSPVNLAGSAISGIKIYYVSLSSTLSGIWEVFKEKVLIFFMNAK